MVLDMLGKYITNRNVSGIRHLADNASMATIEQAITRWADAGEFETLANLFEDHPRESEWPERLHGYIYEAVVRTSGFPPHYLDSPEETLARATQSGEAPDRHYLIHLNQYDRVETQRNKVRQWRERWPEREPLWTALYGLTRKAATTPSMNTAWDELWPLINHPELADCIQEAVLNDLTTKAFRIGDYEKARNALTELLRRGHLRPELDYIPANLKALMVPDDMTDAEWAIANRNLNPTAHPHALCVSLLGVKDPGDFRFGLNQLSQGLSQDSVSLEDQARALTFYPVDSLLHKPQCARIMQSTLGHLLLLAARETLGQDNDTYAHVQAIALALGTPLKDICAEGQSFKACVDDIRNIDEPQNWRYRALALNLINAARKPFIPKAMEWVAKARQLERAHSTRYPTGLSGSSSLRVMAPILADNHGFMVSCIRKALREDRMTPADAEALIDEFLVPLEGEHLRREPGMSEQVVQLIREIAMETPLSDETRWLEAVLSLREHQNLGEHGMALMKAFTLARVDEDWTMTRLLDQYGEHHTRSLLATWLETTEEDTGNLAPPAAQNWLLRLDSMIESDQVDPDIAGDYIGESLVPEKPMPLESLTTPQLMNFAAIFAHCTCPDERGFAPIGHAPTPVCHKEEWLEMTIKDAFAFGIFSMDPYSPESVMEKNAGGRLLRLTSIIPYPLEPSLKGRSASEINARLLSLLKERLMAYTAEDRVRLWRHLSTLEAQGYWQQRMRAHDLPTNLGPKLLDGIWTMTEQFPLSQIFTVIYNAVNRAAGLKHEHQWDRVTARNTAVGMLNKDFERAINDQWTIKSFPRRKTQTMPTLVSYAITHLLNIDDNQFDDTVPSTAPLTHNTQRVTG